MFRRYALGFSSVGRQLSTMSTTTPLEDTIRAKITAAFQPQTLEIYNDSHLHAHHKPMQGSTSSETHFRVVITSAAFDSKMQPARHRMVYALLRDEMAREGGIHALQLRTLTPQEEERQQKKKDQEAKAKADLESAEPEAWDQITNQINKQQLLREKRYTFFVSYLTIETNIVHSKSLRYES